MAQSVGLICAGLSRTEDREATADALTQVAALPCSPEDIQFRNAIADAGGLDMVKATLLGHGDIRLQCKAANALASLCMSEDIVKGFSAAPNSSAVVDRLGDMLRSRSQWAQADAASCLGWLVNSLVEGPALHELTPLMTRLMVKHTTRDDELFIREGKQRMPQATWGRNRGRIGSRGRGDRGVTIRRGGGSGGRGGDSEDDQARERMDNIRVYTLVFLLKASHVDPTTMPAMVEAGAIPGLLRHIESSTEATGLTPGRQQQSDDATSSAQLGGASAHQHRSPHEPAEQDEEARTCPSLFLAARLLYAFSLEPCLRMSLLEARSLPPLIRLRRRLQTAAAAAAAAAAPEHKSITSRARGSMGKMSGVVGEKGIRAEDDGFLARDRTTQSTGTCVAVGESGSAMLTKDESNIQPSLEEMVALIIHQIVGKAS